MSEVYESEIVEECQYVLKGHKAFVKARTSIEKVRKELKAPALEYGKKVDGVAKDFQSMIAQTEQSLLVQRKIVEDNEKRKQEEYEQAERERRDAIRLKIEGIKNLPLDHFNSDSETLTKVLESLRTITTDEFEEFYDDAKAIQETTISQLQAARENAVKTEEAAKIQAENEARLAEEQRIKDEALAKEREEFEREKAELQRERDEMEREKRETQEAIDLKNAEIESERVQKEQEEQAKQKRLEDEELHKAREVEAINAMSQYYEADQLLLAIIEGEIPYVKWEV